MAALLAITTPSGPRPAELVDARLQPRTVEKLKGARWRRPLPFDDPDDLDFEPDDREPALGRCKALYFKDIALFVLRPKEGKRLELGIKILYKFHKGCDEKTLPYVEWFREIRFGPYFTNLFLQDHYQLHRTVGPYDMRDRTRRQACFTKRLLSCLVY